MKPRNQDTFPVDTHWSRILYHDWLRPSSPRAPEPPPALRENDVGISPSVSLDRANSLRIRNGRGTRIRVASGVLWVTEENGLADHTLTAGDSLDLTCKGTAIAFAHRPSRVILDVPLGLALSRSIDLVLTEGVREGRIAFALPSLFASGAAAIVRTVMASVLQAIRGR